MASAKPLFEFWKDSSTRDNVHEYLVQYLKDEAVRMLMDKEDVIGIAEAKEFIDKAFDNMDLLFESKPKSKKIINESR
jgi:hypothetical protein